MQAPEHAREGHEEKLLALLVPCMQAPGAPIVRAVAVHEGPDDALRALMSLGQILDVDPTRIQDELIRVGTMEIDVRHDRLHRGAEPDRARFICPAETSAGGGMTICGAA